MEVSGAVNGTGVAKLAEDDPPQMLLMALAGRAELVVGKVCCCEEKLLSGTKEGICQGWLDASDGLEMVAAGAEKARVTEAGGFLETNGGAPEA